VDDYDAFIERFPEFVALGSQHRGHVVACLREARRMYDDIDMVLLKAAALIAESPVGRAAQLMLAKATSSIYSVRLAEMNQIIACGDRFQ
jgi:hypothetical protein